MAARLFYIDITKRRVALCTLEMCPKRPRFQHNECRDSTNILRKVYMTLIRSVVTYACETWALSTWVTNNLLVFERQILRKISGPIKPKKG